MNWSLSVILWSLVTVLLTDLQEEHNKLLSKSTEQTLNKGRDLPEETVQTLI